MKLLDLFSGIGGFSLGLERSGHFETVAFCEIEPYCRAVLAKHWPKVPCYDDIRTLTADRLKADGIAVDAICGGFPCQDISNAGRRAGIGGERSGLWSEYARLIGELRPRFVIVENVAALLGRGINVVLGDLATLGFDAEWHCIPASAVGAPHRRDRIWIVAHPHGDSQHDGAVDAKVGIASEPLADSSGAGLEGLRSAVRISSQLPLLGEPGYLGNPTCQLSHGSGTGAEQTGRRKLADAGWWQSEPDVGRVAHGLPNRMDRLRALGNAVVPQIPEIIGRAIGGTL